ncbi:MAG: hypothetical protein STSR0004_22980 [Peptococcaceae bacterium]
MHLALDTNVICALLNGESSAEAVASVLEENQRLGSLLISGQVYGELLVMYPKEDLLSFFKETATQTLH